MASKCAVLGRPLVVALVAVRSGSPRDWFARAIGSRFAGSALVVGALVVRWVFHPGARDRAVARSALVVVALVAMGCKPPRDLFTSLAGLALVAVALVA